MEMRSVNTDHPKAPVSGSAVYVVVEEGDHKVTLFHPWTLTELTIPREEYTKGMGSMMWPENETGAVFSVKKVVQTIDDKVKFFTVSKRGFPVRTVIRVLAALKGETVANVEKSISIQEATAKASSSSKTVRQYELAKKVKLADYKGRQHEILGVLSRGPATVTAIADAIKYVPKMKVDQDPIKQKEREILWVLKQVFMKQGLVRIKE